MPDIDTIITRRLLAEAHKLVKQHFPKVNLMRDAWTYHFQRDHWEFHIVNDPTRGIYPFYWHGRAFNAYEARYKGWMAFLQSKGIDDHEAAA